MMRANIGEDLFAKCTRFDEPARVRAAGVYPFFRAIEDTAGARVRTGGRERVMLGSNNYLGLTHHPRVREAAKNAIDRFGTGCTGSRFLNGNLALHEDLEERLARFLGKESALVMSTGFLTNLGTLSCLVGRGDVIYSDRENHASIVEGARASLGETVKYRHNDMQDLERVLSLTRDRHEGALIVTDGVFSMSGDVVRLPELCRLARKYRCRIYLDDAHSLGVLGPQGRGTEAEFGLHDEVDLVMGTFSKSFASIGGVIAGRADVVDFIRHRARSFIFSAAMPPAAAATVLACLEVMKDEPEHLDRLWKNAGRMQEGLEEMGFCTLGSRTPIIPLLIGDDASAFAFAQRLFDEGVFATPVVKPAVPDGCALIRTSTMACHSDEDLEFALGVLRRVGREFGVIGSSGRRSELLELSRIHFNSPPRVSAASSALAGGDATAQTGVHV